MIKVKMRVKYDYIKQAWTVQNVQTYYQSSTIPSCPWKSNTYRKVISNSDQTHQNQLILAIILTI